jgi:xanthine dehydrogenase YagT iron-sulfur-binding subunit
MNESKDLVPLQLSPREFLQVAGSALSAAALPLHAAAPADRAPPAAGSATNKVQLTINGQARTLELDPRQSLCATSI